MHTLESTAVFIMFIQRCLALRLHCSCSGSFVMGRDNIFNNYSMGASVAKRLISTVHSTDCFTRCIEEDCKCVSFSFERKTNAEGMHRCQMNYESKESQNSSFIERDGWDYHKIIYEVCYDTVNVIRSIVLFLISSFIHQMTNSKTNLNNF